VTEQTTDHAVAIHNRFQRCRPKYGKMYTKMLFYSNFLLENVNDDIIRRHR